MKDKPRDFEQTFARIEAIVKQLESGKLALQENLTLFEEAQLLIQALEKALHEAETKIKELTTIK
jgi:exodeoxyribonuclease VII small subunit